MTPRKERTPAPRQILIRRHVARLLKDVLDPLDYRIEPNQRIPDRISRPTAILKQQRIGRAIQDGTVIPGGRIAGFVLTLATKYETTVSAENALDDNVVDLLNAIDGIPNLRWTSAEKRILSEATNAPCYDVELEFVFQHKRPIK